MADIAPSLATATVPPIDVAELWSSLVDFSNYSPVALEPKPNTRSAAVTIILRFTRGGQVLDLNMLSSNDGLLNDSGLITAVLGEDAVGEILFIKRSVNPRDRWSGHVALPGGRQEESEPLKRTASRETLEEVGLDLESEEYKYVGALDDRYTMPINIRPFLISAHVFLQVKPGTLTPKLDANEVASCRWVPLSTFYNARIDHVSYPMNVSATRSGPSTLSIGTMNFPGIILPEGEEFFPDDGPHDVAYTYHLWGITLDIIEDLVVHFKLCKRGTISHLPRSLNPLVKFYIWHHHYVPHSLKGAPFWSGLLLLTTAAGFLAWWKWFRK